MPKCQGRETQPWLKCFPAEKLLWRGRVFRMSRTFSSSQTSERNLSEAVFSASEKLFLNSVIRLSGDCGACVARALDSLLASLRIRTKRTWFPAGDRHIHPSFGNELVISLNVEKLLGYWHKATLNQLAARRSHICDEGLWRHRNAVIVPIKYSQNVKVSKPSPDILKYFCGLLRTNVVYRALITNAKVEQILTT